jgi:pimeloyl-ACP methyl ester carboxylesterase
MPEWILGDVIVNGVKIHYHRTGGDNPPVVLAHGLTDSGLCWARLAQALEDEYDLVMYDARGHGLSGVPETGYAPEEHVADMAGLVTALGLERPALIGHSMGASNVALTIATHPSLARCAILEDPVWCTYDLGAQPGRMDEWHADLIAKKSRTREDLMAEERVQQPTWAEIEFGVRADAKLRVNPDVLTWISPQNPPIPWRDVVRKFACPVLLITADPKLGAVVTSEVAWEAASLCASLEVVYIPSVGHHIRYGQFELYVEAVRAFLTCNL